MKTKFLKAKKRILYTPVALLMLSACPLLTTAQSGANDASFNKSDKIPAQGANDVVYQSAIQPDNKLILTGKFTKYNGTETKSVVRLNTDGTLDKNFTPALEGNYGPVAVQPNGKILVAGVQSFGGVLPEPLVRLHANGNRDNNFNAAIDSLSEIAQVIVQPDEKILLLGRYYAPGQFPVARVLRLNKNGSLDNTFQPVIGDSIRGLLRIALQPDGKVLVAGVVPTDWGMTNYFSAIRLNANGSRDYSYQLSLVGASDSYLHINDVKVEADGGVLIGVAFTNGSSLSNNGIVARFAPDGSFVTRLGLFWINSIAIQPDGKIVFAGTKNLGFNLGKTEVRRLNHDLSVDASFTFDQGKTYTAVNRSELKTVSLQVDGKLVIAGDFTEVDGQIGNNVTRLNADGKVDLSFNQRKGCDGSLFASAVQANGKVIIGGQFSRYNSQSTPNVARLKSNGEFDPTFNVGTGTNGKVNAVAIQSDGKILIGGKFTLYNGQPVSNIARLNKDGSLDASFTATTDNIVRKIKVASNGKILIAGDFKNVNGSAKHAVARLLSNGTSDAAFTTSIALTQQGGAYDLAIAGNGRIYVALNYKDSLDDFTYDAKLLRLKNNGTTDAGFVFTDDTFYEIHAVTLNNDGKPLVSGEADPAYEPYGRIILYNTDGSIDAAFHSDSLSYYLQGSIRTINVLENNKVIIGGDFFNHILLLNEHGGISDGFVGTASNTIYTTTPVGTSQLIIGGTFSEYEGAVRNSIARIDVAAPAVARMAVVTTDAREEQISVYPNPVASDISATDLTPGNTLKIYDAAGVEKYSKVITNEQEHINVSNYANGTYLLIIIDNSGSRSSAKFVVNK